MELAGVPGQAAWGAGMARDHSGGRSCRSVWRRDTELATFEVLPCADASRGNGLFAVCDAEADVDLFQEEPVPGTAIMLLKEHAKASPRQGARPLQARNCAHCAVPVPDRSAIHRCSGWCDAAYCSARCRELAWEWHHEALCPATNAAWARFLDHAAECSNEYYVVAARLIAALRAKSDDGAESAGCCDPPPWSGYAAPPWWETMRRPRYGSSSASSQGESASDSASSEGDECQSPAQLDGAAVGVGGQPPSGGCGSPQAPFERTRSSSCGGSEPQGSAEDERARSSTSDASVPVGRASGGCSSEGRTSKDGDSSLDRFFVAAVRQQTAETVGLLRDALAGVLVPGCPASVALAEGSEGFGRLVGMLRVNALSVQADRPCGESGRAARGPRMARGLAIYALTSAMNHSDQPNCYVASDPARPSLAVVRAMMSITAGDELCIDYLQGAPFGAGDRRRILRRQYGIEC